MPGKDPLLTSSDDTCRVRGLAQTSYAGLCALTFNTWMIGSFCQTHMINLCFIFGCHSLLSLSTKTIPECLVLNLLIMPEWAMILFEISSTQILQSCYRTSFSGYNSNNCVVSARIRTRCKPEIKTESSEHHFFVDSNQKEDSSKSEMPCKQHLDTLRLLKSHEHWFYCRACISLPSDLFIAW